MEQVLERIREQQETLNSFTENLTRLNNSVVETRTQAELERADEASKHRFTGLEKEASDHRFSLTRIREDLAHRLYSEETSGRQIVELQVSVTRAEQLYEQMRKEQELYKEDQNQSRVQSNRARWSENAPRKKLVVSQCSVV